MTPSRQKSQRGFVRHGAVAERLRHAIAEGLHQPGARLPAHVDLQKQFGTTPVTVQRALHQLRAEGFIRTLPNSGTFVAENPPHLWRYGLLFPDRPSNYTWGRFHAALSTVVEQANALGPRKIEMYYGLDGHADAEDFRRVLDDIANRRLAGLMFARAPHELMGTPILDDPKVLRVFPGERRGWEPFVGPAWNWLMSTALEWIAAQGRRNVSVITLPSTKQADVEETIRGFGLNSLPFWTQAVDSNATEWVRHAVYGILHSHPSRVPDAMLVTDDHLVEAVADALIEFGVRVPDDMLVVGHWNFPLKFNRDIPVQLIGVDNVDRVRRWVAAIDAQQRGEPVPAKTIVQPVLAGKAELCQPIEIQRLPAPASTKSAPRYANRK
jgi:DNA-binding LacI/PurR family transcriptional regulator